MLDRVPLPRAVRRRSSPVRHDVPSVDARKAGADTLLRGEPHIGEDVVLSDRWRTDWLWDVAPNADGELVTFRDDGTEP